MELIEVSAPDWGKEVSPRSQAEPLLPRVVGRGKMLVELLLGHHALHLIEHPFLDQPLGTLRIPDNIMLSGMHVTYGALSFVSPCAVLIEESPQKNSFPSVYSNRDALWQPRVDKVGNGVDLGLGGDVGGSSLDHGHVAGGVGDAG